MIKFKKGLSIALSLAMALTIGGIVQGSDASAAKKVKLSKKKITIKVGSQKKLTLKNSTKKAKWKIASGKKYISLKKKKKFSVVIKGKKAGKAVVVAKVGKKKYKCKIVVSKKKTTTKTTETQTPKVTAKVTATPTPAPTSGAKNNSGTSATPTPTPIVDVTSFTMKSESLTAVKTAGDPTPTLDLFEIEPAKAASQIQYEIDDEGIVKYDEKTSSFVAVGTGKTKIHLTTGDNKKTGECTVEVKKNTSAVHDPSIFKDPNASTPTYYTIGTNLGFAKSSDLQEWTTLPGGDNLFKNGSSELDEVFSYIGESYNAGLIWAGDMIYNTKMKKYCIYACLGGSSKQVIFLLTSSNPEKDYEYQGMIVCSGIDNSNLNKSNLLDALGVDSLSEVPGSARYINNHISDAIDPQPFYDGKELYLTWGAFAGDSYIHLLKLDPRTGLRNPDLNYDYVESGDDKADPYYGKYLTAAHQGEGGYIIKIKDTSKTSSTGYWYFLYTSNGNLNAPRTSGSYRMTVFRSENVEGPYLDMNGNKALDNKNNGTPFLYNYKFNFMENAFVAMGHNSAMYDEETGQAFIEYHNKFSDGSGAPGTHMIKTHQMFLNSDGWPVVTPYEYHGEKLGTVSKRKVAGNYEIIIHNQSSAIVDGSYNYIESKSLVLDKDGGVSGAFEGQWTLDEETGAFKITTGKYTYDGYILEQYEDDSAASGNISSRNKTIVFTGIGTGTSAIYGSKITTSDIECAQYDASKLTINEKVSGDFTLPTVGAYGSTISWSSANKNIISISGSNATVSPALTDETVKLTATIQYNDETTTRAFDVIVEKMEFKIANVVASNTIELPTTLSGHNITWTSNNTSVITNDGSVTRSETEFTSVKLTASLDGGEAEYEFDVTVLPTAVDSDASWSPVYTQDYQNVASVTDVFSSVNNANGLSIITEDTNKYLNFDMASGGSGNRGALSSAFTGLTGNEVLYKIDFDLLMRSGNIADKSQSRFVITSEDDTVAAAGNNGASEITTNYLLKLATAWNSTEWTLNDGEEKVTLPSDAWVHVNLLVQGNSVFATFKNGDEIIGQYNLEIKGQSNVAKCIYLLDGRGTGLVKLDNIKISNFYPAN